jgi:F420-dependent oxidoreductase-like protein
LALAVEENVAMRLGIILPPYHDPRDAVARARAHESAGVDVVWTTEAYGFDAVSLLGAIAVSTSRIQLASGILPIYSRTPALTAMTAAGLDALSAGRFILGIGASGPQVIEGWHGVPYDRPIQSTREVIEICRKVWRRDRLEHDGTMYQLPLGKGRGIGQGKPLKLINTPVRERIPIYVAGLGPQNVRMTAEVADGWIPLLFHPDRAAAVWSSELRVGLERRSADLAPLEIAAGGPLCICDDDQAQKLRDLERPRVALYVGGMGSVDKNFYNQLFARMGYEAEAAAIQRAYLAGRKNEAEALIPDNYLAAVSLVGDEGYVKERVAAYAAAGVTCLTIKSLDENPMPLVDKLRSWTP